MPDRSKIRWSQLKVGVVSLTAFAIVFVLVFLLTSSKGGLFQKNALLRTYMDDASGIADGSPVRLNGFPVGYLDSIQLTGSRDPKRTVEFAMQIRAEFLNQIPVDSVAGIAAANLLGDKFINITKGSSTQMVKEGAEIASLNAQDIPELMGQMGSLLHTFQTIVTRVDTLLASVEAGKGTIGKFLVDEELYTRLNGIASEGQKLLADVRGGGGTIAKLIYDPALYNELRSPISRLDDILKELQAGRGTAGKILKDPSVYDEAQKTIAEIRTLLNDVNAGKGTAGKLFKDDQLARHLDELVAKFSGLVDKINAGQGTLGQFVVNPQLYETLNGATREFQSLAKDMRANPKKFLTIRLVLF
jgi:phospholipid/cholesterol/gamma-HCH transport system substrate-binding protein